MSVDLREAYRSAAAAVRPMGDVEQAVRRGRSRRVAIVAAPVAVLALVAGAWLVIPTGGDEPPVAQPQPEAVTAAADLAGRTFVTPEGFSDDGPLILMFSNTELTLTTPTNRHTADYRIGNDVLMVAPATYACGGVDCGWRLLGLIHSRPTIALTGTVLTLTGPDSRVTLVDQQGRNSARLLEDRTWALHSDRTFTLRFESGSVLVRHDCNRGLGEVEIAEQTIDIGRVPMSLMGCMSDEPAVDRTVGRVLFADGPLVYWSNGTRLILINSEGGQLVYPRNVIEIEGYRPRSL